MQKNLRFLIRNIRRTLLVQEIVWLILYKMIVLLKTRTSSAWHRRSLNWVRSAKEKVGKIKVWMMRCVNRSSNVEKCITVIRGVRNSRKMLVDLLTKTKSFQHNLKCRLYLTIGYFANNILLQADTKVGNFNNPTPQTR